MKPTSVDVWLAKNAIDIPVGARVRALRVLDPNGANVSLGELGIVTAPRNAHGDGLGPLVEWDMGGVCNVYKGNVEVIR